METGVLGGKTGLRGSIEAFLTPEIFVLLVVVLCVLALGAWVRHRRGPSTPRTLFLSVLLGLPVAVVASVLIVGLKWIVAASITGVGVVASI